MEVLNVSFDEATELVTITFHPEKALEAKKFFKQLFEDDNQVICPNVGYSNTCGICDCNPCVCGGIKTVDPMYDPALYPQNGTTDSTEERKSPV